MYSPKDLKENASPTDCWIAIREIVYDITNVNQHPAERKAPSPLFHFAKPSCSNTCQGSYLSSLIATPPDPATWPQTSRPNVRFRSAGPPRPRGWGKA